MPKNYDLTVVNEAYGADADLYLDVLQVSYFSSDDEIQSAFFDRRSEIFGVLSRLTSEEQQNFGENAENDEVAISQRRLAEKRMDAIVMTFRILKDPDLRAIYEGERERRLANRSDWHQMQPNKNNNNTSTDTAAANFQLHSSPKLVRSSPRGVYSFDDEVSNYSVATGSKDVRTQRLEQKLGDASSPRAVEISVNYSPSQKTEKTYVTDYSIDENDLTEISHCDDTCTEMSFQEGETTLDGSFTDEEDQIVAAAIKAQPKKGEPAKGIVGRIRNSRLVRTVVEECSGACMDTTMAFDQVCNAFTLQEREIDAVCGRIHKAKRQLTTK
mmetsp:Transcript_22351/g.33021  ORF Transcript_22351/g.33021 Transcript_22351/m.33021 type:complete len:328 (-) Transcript_22351:168-1151(-)|eukprot:CAMPEP_0194201720 /NCGR_PEP_ID=MMETSP0156-20130528/1932_1 /TAXON_ID=33649 /ORGANISM="Thalassionema nitzschioides, Strain L26-B" /LENGTH=327 /DNA_ID=CAMNT_0038927005 /DNA_START=123 /DNA_END=1106 /DNA_ORIENTATION=-